MFPVFLLIVLYTLILFALSLAFAAYLIHSIVERIVRHTLHTRDHPNRDNNTWGDAATNAW